MRRRPAVLVAAALALAGCSGSTPTSSPPPSAAEPATTFAPGTTAASRPPSMRLYDAACAGLLNVSTEGQINQAISELSGLVASRANRGVLWTHNDSGNEPFLYAISTTGELLATYQLTGVTNDDWEDIAIGRADGGGDAVYLADIGGGGTKRRTIVLYSVAEPVVAATGAADGKPDEARPLAVLSKITLNYPDGRHDAEAMFVDPVTGDAVIITKEEDGPAIVFTAKAASLKSGATVTLEEQGTVDFGGPGLAAQVTGADISPSGDTIAVRTYGGVSLFDRAAGQSIMEALAGTRCRGPFPEETQGEAIAFSPDGGSYYTAAEGQVELHLTD